LSGANYETSNSHETLIKNLTRNVEISQEINTADEKKNIESTIADSNKLEGKISESLDENKENNNSETLNEEKGEEKEKG